MNQKQGEIVEVDLPGKPALSVLEELAHTLHNLRFWTKFWHEHGGRDARDTKKRWEDRADRMLDKLGLKTHNNIEAVRFRKDENGEFTVKIN